MNYLKVFVLLLVFGVSACSSPAQNGKAADSTYEFRRGDPSGIGKWFMEREIAHVMGYQGMGWLERSQREKEENTSLLLQNMNIQPSDRIADIGAGSGYHVFKMANLAHKGRIYAVDIQEEMLDAMRKKKEKGNFPNVELVKGTIQGINLPEGVLDKVLMVDVYHEFSYPLEMLASIKKALKPNGQIYLIEYRAEDDRVPIKRLHKMSEEQSIKELNEAGFELKQNIDNLPWQHCMIFIKQKQ